MLLKESLQKHEKKQKENHNGGVWEGKGLQSNNFCVVNYLICIPSIGTLFLSTSKRLELECYYSIGQFHWQLLKKGFYKVVFNFISNRVPHFFFPKV